MLTYFCIGLLSLYGVVASYFCIKFAMIVLRVQDELQNSLAVIDEKYESISEILSRPLFFDSPEVRQVLRDIESTRDSLERVASKLTSKLENKEEESSILNEG